MQDTDEKTGKNRTFWRRVIAFLIDGFLMQGVVRLAWIAVGIPPERLEWSSLAEMVQVLQSLTPQERLTLSLLPIALEWLYFTFLESSESQATLGKRIMGLVVTDLEGQPITLARASIRHFAKIISACTLFYGYVMVLSTSRRQTLHDIIARCLVVKKTEETTTEESQQGGHTHED